MRRGLAVEFCYGPEEPSSFPEGKPWLRTCGSGGVTRGGTGRATADKQGRSTRGGNEVSAAVAGRKKLLTLGEVARRSNVSMATAQRYKKLYQDRIPSEGEGRKQRYTVGAVKVFNDLKKERVSKRRGGGRKRSARKSAKAAASGTGLLTLSSIGKQTGISYPTLQRYVKLFGDRIPHEGEGRKRRYHPDSVAVFRQLRASFGLLCRAGIVSRGCRHGGIGIGESVLRTARPSPPRPARLDRPGHRGVLRVPKYSGWNGAIRRDSR